MEAPFPRSPTHPVTEEGNAAHWVAERVLSSWLVTNPEPAQSAADYLGAKCPENGLIVTDEMVYGVTVYLMAIWEQVHGYLAGLQVEKQLSLRPKGINTHGRADAVWRSLDGTRVVVWDLKFGYGVVSAVANWQLLIYAAAMAVPETTHFEIVIVQPRGSSAARPVKTSILTREEFAAYRETIKRAAEIAESPNPYTQAGPHCRNCKALPSCETSRAAGSHIIDDSFKAVNVHLSDNELAYELEALDRALDLVKSRRDALDALAITRIDTGHNLPGFRRSRSMSNRKWTKSKEEIFNFGKLFGVDLAESKPCTPAQAQGRGIPEDVVNIYTHRTEGAAKLVRVAPNEAREVFQK